jgi:hypothetical protein
VDRLFVGSAGRVAKIAGPYYRLQSSRASIARRMGAGSIGQAATIRARSAASLRSWFGQRLARGLYYYPRTNPRLGIVVSANADEIAAALARQTGSRIAPLLCAS